MAHVRELLPWSPYRFFPWAEWRKVGWYLDTAPSVPVTSTSFWIERRWRRKEETA